MLSFDVGSVLIWLLVTTLGYHIIAAFWIRSEVRNLPHVRYNKLHVYADFGNGSLYHVPGIIFGLYMHIKDPNIKELQGVPRNPKVFLRWEIARVAAGIWKQFTRPGPSQEITSRGRDRS